MKDDEKDGKLLSLMEVRRPEAFWQRQRNAIIGAAAEKRGPSRAWLLAPAAVAALVFFLARLPGPAPEPDAQIVSTAFLEHLDLLDDMDVLEAVPENEL
ncbi:MAG: hypothetical protein A2X28_06145 [Elusimicrobia bacterium GWA2_56_46]|nr:MAG: hypothetical protein A2X28_06145 [Elusimicrobia bacterium GWA2_56_46]OGR54613.1 MAG: hypothetical protein A2X39_02195 [Elusimicrobia bacterium GWC2_56_31]HBB67751.1 hypothetical protein [Elusimicrobiota bacterium]HBW23906.1 hypothetical protein [Elusimicrobiota bacterium]